MSTQQGSSAFDGMQPLPTITPTTYQAVQRMMEEDGTPLRDNQQVSQYVQKLIARESFFRVADKIQERNQNLDAELIQQEVSAAVEEAKEQRRKQNADADRA